jgi:ribosomal-protein-alanine N-acetyltransferase
MIKRDHEEVLEIEAESFSEPWGSAELISVVKDKEVTGITCEYQEIVVGYYIYRAVKTKMDIIRFAVHPDYRRQGVGESMMNNIKNKLQYMKFKYASVNVDEYNLEGQLFFRALGFKYIKTFKGDEHDSYLMSFRKEDLELTEE